MEVLKFDRNGRIFIEGEPVNLSEIENIEDFMVSMLDLEVSLVENITLGELVHSMYDLRGFIQKYLSEEYEVIRAMAISSILSEGYECVKLFKSFRIEQEEILVSDNYISILPEAELKKPEKGIGISRLSDLPVIIDENISINHEGLVLTAKAKFTLKDLVSAVFEELCQQLREDPIISAQ